MVGLPKAIIKKYGITKQAWAVFRGQKRSRKAYKPQHNTVIKRRGRTMARKKRGYSRGFSTQSMFKWLRIGALAAPAAYWAMQPNMDAKTKIALAMRSYTGYNFVENKFDAQYLMGGWAPFILTTVLTHGVSKLGGIIRKL